MPIQYSCFISYRHGQDDIMRNLALSLKRELKYWLDIDVFLDEERLTGGDFFNKKLAKALCESVCLIVIYTPTYFSEKNTYCAREYKAMERLERERLRALGLPKNQKHGFIIPLVYRGEKFLPKSIKNERQFYLFESFQVSRRDNLDNPEYAKQILKIAEYIKERHEELQALEVDFSDKCNSFTR